MNNNHKELFDVITEQQISRAVENAFTNLNQTYFGRVSIQQMNLNTQVICSIFHELIVHEIASLPHWRAGKQKTEADLIHTKTHLPLQVKTSSRPDGIAGNRYSSKNEYSNPSEYYLCVNFIPFECISKIRAGFIPSDAWKPQSGKGNASTLNPSVLSNLPFIKGDYIKEQSFLTVKGIGNAANQKLKAHGIHTLKDLFVSQNYETMKKIVKNKQVLSQINFLLEGLNHSKTS